MPSGATRGAAKRAFTYSFGSISFGSLVVALINMVRQAVSIAQQYVFSESTFPLLDETLSLETCTRSLDS